MRKLNVLLTLLIVGVLLVPGVVVAQVAEACCGVLPVNLVVDDAPDPACVDDEVTISGTYNTSPLFEPFTPYDTWVVLRVWAPGDVPGSDPPIVDETIPKGTDVAESPVAVDFSFSHSFTASEEGTYNYEVIAWTTGDPMEDQSILVGGTITVEDCNEPPDCSNAEPSISVIWPPNHKFVDINILGVTDPDGDPVAITITSIKQDEHLEILGDGNHEPDGTGVGTDTASVRAERSGTKKVPGDGRVYHIYFTADDGQGGFCTGEVQVGVPHDVKDTPVDGGALFDSTAGG